MRKKLKRFSDNQNNPYILEPSHDEYSRVREQWKGLLNTHHKPLVLEIGAGKGDYTIALAINNPSKAFVGIDIKGDRLWHASQYAQQHHLTNVRMLRAPINHIEYLFDKASVDELWITFPDPRPKKGDAKKRLTNHRFIRQYKHILKPGAKLHLKTDNCQLFGYSIEQILTDPDFGMLYGTADLYHETSAPTESTHIKTHFEKKYLAQDLPIHYLKVQYNPAG